MDSGVQEQTEGETLERLTEENGDDEIGANVGPPTGRGARPKQRTEKGRAYIAHVRWKDCHSLESKVMRQMKRIDSLTENTEHVHSVVNDLEAFHFTREEFGRAFVVLLDDLESSDEINVATTWYEEQNRRINDFTERIKLWISMAKGKIEETIERSSVCSRVSKTSTRSKASSKSSVASGRAKERAKAAELMAKAAMLEERQALEHKAERLRLEEELAVAQARERAYAEMEREENGEHVLGAHYREPAMLIPPSHSLSADGMPEFKPLLTTVTSTRTVPSHAADAHTTGRASGLPSLQSLPRPVQYTMLNPSAPEFSLKSQLDSRQNVSSGSFQEVLNKQNQLTEMIVEQHQQSLLPPLTISKFTGDHLEYDTFIRSFESQIESKLKSNDVRLRYLDQYLDGEPKELIKGCLHLGNTHGFPEAKKLLREKYGDPYKVSNAYIKKISEWPCIKPGEELALDRFSTFLIQCRSAMSTLTYLCILDHPHNMQSMVKKLPFHLQDRWRREANRIRVTREKIPEFADFVTFVKTEAVIATDSVFSREALSRLDNEDRPNKLSTSGRTPSKPKFSRDRITNYVSSHATSVAGQSNAEERNTISSCILCQKDHDLDDCPAYLKKNLQDRKAFLKEKELCFACYGHGHRSKGCAIRRICKTCSRRHPTGLHDDNFRLTQAVRKRQSIHVASSNKVTDAVTSAHTVMDEATCDVNRKHSVAAVPIVPVKLTIADRAIVTYAMLDNCSSGTFISEDVAVSLGAKGTSTKVLVKTVNGAKVHDARVINGLVVTDLKGNSPLKLPKTFTTKSLMTTIEDDIPTPALVHRWQHLQRITTDLPPHLPGAKIGLLIGTNCPKALEPKDFLASENGGPFAVKTFAGWAIVGPLLMSNKEHLVVSCNRIAAKEIGSERHFDHHFMIENKVKELVTPQALNKMFQLDFCERSDDKEQGYSHEDKEFIAKVHQGIRNTEDNHYEIPLPFRTEDVHMPDNREQVAQRARWLKRKLAKDDKLYKDYVTFMDNIIAKGYARKVPTDRIATRKGKVWYIPHHGIYHPKKPDKIRVVFDCSAEFGGTSLNEQLLQGPDLTNRLVGVLTRFRQEQVAFMGDIEAMFHQVRVPEDQRDYLRFLWWPDGALSQSMEEYQMNVHLFGAVSSPSCSNFALRRAADDAEEQVGSETADALRKNFYVDDCLRSEESEELAITRIHGVRSACAYGGFNLTKFVCNRRDVLQAIPQQERAKEVRSLDLSHDHLPVERALGVQWSIESDTLGFRILLKDKPFTRRGILSTISSIYDPLGIAAPFLLVGKKILQDLCRINLGWDDEINDEYRSRWEKWRSQLPLLEQFSMDRCFKPDGFGQVTSRQIHNFSDASSSGYGQVSYLRIVNDKGNIHCAFLMGKSRLSPLKTMTIPRLELTAATVSVRVGAMIARELDDTVDSETYWTDSTTVMKYIRNEQKRFHVFVANRVQTIRDKSSPEQWRYVESKLNPADDASRGLNGCDLVRQQRWIRGPTFLWLTEDKWPQLPPDLDEIPLDDPEVKKFVVRTSIVIEKTDILERFERFSDWHRLKKSIAWILRIKPKSEQEVLASKDGVKSTKKGSKSNYRPLRVEELEQAEKTILKLVQNAAFPQEIKVLRKISQGDCPEPRQLARMKKSEIKRSSSLYRLDPVLDKDGLLRVGGRLGNSEVFPDDFKHPIILPKKSHIVDLILRHAHQAVAHAGRGITLGNLRSRYWVISANSAVRSLISKCVECRRLRAPVEEQKMADLPKERITPAPPFTYCGVDYFGPLYIKEGRKVLKRYGALFTCLASRAIHIETSNSLDTDSFINALRRFIARRGPIREIRSDQGTNIVGAEKELKRALGEMDHNAIQRSLCRDSKADWVHWKQNPPSASHMGGVWERQIRSVRSIMTALVREYGHALDDESLRTLLTEVECIINSRPLTAPSSDPNDLDPLTPNHILTMKSKVVMPPPGNFQKTDVFLRKRWKRVQYLLNVFWSRWRKEYVQCLQQRVKWNCPKRNLEKGDLVLITDNRMARNNWPMARVIETHPDSRGQVRSVKIATATTTLDRPINKLLLLLDTNDQG